MARRKPVMCSHSWWKPVHIAVSPRGHKLWLSVAACLMRFDPETRSLTSLASAYRKCPSTPRPLSPSAGLLSPPPSPVNCHSESFLKFHIHCLVYPASSVCFTTANVFFFLLLFLNFNSKMFKILVCRGFMETLNLSIY